MAHPKVLAVEDDDDLRFLYETFLRTEGLEVVTARDAREGLRLLDEGPDVVLLDLMLPGMDGYEFLEELRRRREHRDTTVIVLSAAIPPGRHRVPGADATIRKPFEFDGLLRAIEGLSHPTVRG